MRQVCSPSGDHIRCYKANLPFYNQQQNAQQATLRMGFFMNYPDPQSVVTTPLYPPVQESSRSHHKPSNMTGFHFPPPAHLPSQSSHQDTF